MRMAKDIVFGHRAKAVCFCAMLLLAFTSVGSADTIVTFQTALGDFDVQLYDTAAPITVANFLNYVNDGDYVNSFFHRLDPGFVLQGGGFTYDSVLGFDYVPVDAPIVNEFNVSNTRGTIAMAKQAGDPDSATNQFFFNLGDNSANLDNQNGGFTVFGEVIGSGMDVVDLLAAQPVLDSTLPPYYLPWPALPLINGSALEMIYGITIPELATLLGDANNDGLVSADDFAIVQANFGNTGAPGVFGDANLDGLVSADDFATVQANFGNHLPEPATLGFLLLGGLALLRRKRSI